MSLISPESPIFLIIYLSAVAYVVYGLIREIRAKMWKKKSED